MGFYATDLLQEMSQAHGLTQEPARGLGEAVMAALSIASYCKQNEKVNLKIQGSGCFRQAFVDASADGKVRGYLVFGDPVVDAESEGSEEPGSLRNQGLWGEGTLSVLRTKHMDDKHPFMGAVPLLTGHLAKDLVFYWHQSEQVPSAVGLFIRQDEATGEITFAGGMLIQALPGASDSEIATIEKHLEQMSDLEEEFVRTGDLTALLGGIFQDTGFTILEKKEIRFECHCSLERVEKALMLVGIEELKTMISEDHQAAIQCDFCAKEYVISEERLNELLEELNPSH